MEALTSIDILAALWMWGVAAAAPWPSLAEPPENPTASSTDAAVIVGIEDYSYLPDVPGAAQNASDWYRWLRAQGIPSENIELLVDTQANADDPQGSRDRILEAVASAAAAAGSEGTVWFLFIGHGIPAKDGSGGLLTGTDAGRSATGVYSRSLSQRDLLTALESQHSGDSVVVLDTCFSGRASTGASLVSGLQWAIPTTLNTAGKRTTVFSAAEAHQFAGPLPGARRPAFSYLLLGALWGWGDADGDGQVTATEADDYTRKAMATVLTDRHQSPGLQSPEPTKVLAFGRSQGPDLDEVRLSQYSGPAGGEQDWIAQLLAEASNEAALTEASRAERAAEESKLMQQATAEWERLAPALQGDEALSVRALKAYIAQWSDRTFEVGGVSYLVRPPEVGLARTALLRTDRLHPGPLPFAADATADQRTALEADRVACNLYDLDACYNLGWAYDKGTRGVEIDDTEAARLYGALCDAGHADGCAGLGYQYTTGGGGVAQSGSKAFELYQQACEAGSGRGCTNLGFMYDNGEGVPQDSTRAVELYRQACGGGYLNGCNNLGFMYENGKGVPQDSTRAVELYRQACDGGEMDGCANLGVMYENGKGVPQDSTRAVELYRQACDGGNDWSCRRL